LSFIEEMQKQGEKIWESMIPKPTESMDSFVERLLKADINPEPGSIPETTYWATLDLKVVGRIALRHGLTEDLSEFGGHIGYEVHPLFRRKGVAKEILKQVLETAKAQEMGRVLLTCAPDNLGSNKTIQANGGILTKTAFVEKWQRDTNYYWIDLRLRL
jgi:predicted acetyltransferase